MTFYKLSQQTQFAILAFAAAACIILLPFGKAPYDFGKRLTIAFALAIPFALSGYSINCMVKGKCNTWAWAQSFSIALWGMLIAVPTVSSMAE